ncbi:glycosyltransferase family 32 protein [Tropicibacter oceani]|uniref:Alpha 1,4-glycosyltransferase domain-containing protein n=1 Tax=Tropicibacter oceani TaxID=3058420 RepID=A0ABY8QJM8_9RHOB|nr:hypothetical protein [Tropicibacter oceani]WGW04720.1 hypothetical protein QF118_03980 [Tropicibacter oceani]
MKTPAQQGAGAALQDVATLWIGGELNWLHQLSLASFVHRGHRVTLYYSEMDAAPRVPDGVETRPAAEIWDAKAAGHEGAPASMQSDIFRLHLLRKTDCVWIDADVLCYRPLSPDVYHVGREPSGTVNGAVLKLPRTSPTLNLLLEWFADPEWVPHWLTEQQQAKVAKAPPGKRMLAAFRLARPSVGPRALKHTMRNQGEFKHLKSPDVYYPVRGVFTDAFFNPKGGVDGWLTEKTQGIHLYASMIRPYHERHMPDPDSFIARFARDIDFEIAL